MPGHAIVEAGIRVRSAVARGVSENAFDVMDTGRSRNAADVLHVHGFRLGDRIYHSRIQCGIGLWSIITTLFCVSIHITQSNSRNT